MSRPGSAGQELLARRQPPHRTRAGVLEGPVEVGDDDPGREAQPGQRPAHPLPGRCAHQHQVRGALAEQVPQLVVIHVRVEGEQDVPGVEARQGDHVPLGTVLRERAHHLLTRRVTDHAQGAGDVADDVREGERPIGGAVIVADARPIAMCRQLLGDNVCHRGDRGVARRRPAGSGCSARVQHDSNPYAAADESGGMG